MTSWLYSCRWSTPCHCKLEVAVVNNPRLTIHPFFRLPRAGVHAACFLPAESGGSGVGTALVPIRLRASRSAEISRHRELWNGGASIRLQVPEPGGGLFGVSLSPVTAAIRSSDISGWNGSFSPLLAPLRYPSATIQHLM